MNYITTDYIAGLIDGEGYIGLWKKPTRSTVHAIQGYQPGIKIAMVGADELLYALQDEFGGYIEYRKSTKPNQRDSVCWTIRNKARTAEFIEYIMPHLVLKKKQAELLLEFCRLGILHPGFAPPERMARADAIHSEIQLLRWQSPATTKRGRPDQVMLKVKR